MQVFLFCRLPQQPHAWRRLCVTVSFASVTGQMVFSQPPSFEPQRKPTACPARARNGNTSQHRHSCRHPRSLQVKIYSPKTSRAQLQGDTQIVKEDFVEAINNVLNSGHLRETPRGQCKPPKPELMLRWRCAEPLCQ